MLPHPISPPFSRRETRRWLDQWVRSRYWGNPCWNQRTVFRRVLNCVRQRSRMLHSSAYANGDVRYPIDRFVAALLLVAHNRDRWIRPLEGWTPSDASPLAAFASLVHHLFARYPIPPVLLSAWFEDGQSWQGRRQRNWFGHVAAGGSLRSAGFPLPISRKMAHAFTQAPATLPIPAALRWAQVRSLGGTDDLAGLVSGSRLGEEYLFDSPFWTSFLGILVRMPRVGAEELALVIDYLEDRRFTSRVGVVGDGVEVELDAPEPEMSLKGRTFASLVRRARAWRAEVRSDAPERIEASWDPLGVDGFATTDEEGRTWTIRELLDSNALAAEGTDLEHCVATYYRHCVRGDSSIWSLGEETPSGRQRVLTVEVNPADRHVVQASMKRNDDPDSRCIALLRAWAGREGLDLSAIEPEVAV